MYQINREKNRIQRLSIKRFAELKFSEKDHLQEWIANEPEALGEELLIVQKEFDGFDDTRERLDLLALNKDANLVIIENKLDDSGKNVVWQALKYASYCSSLNKTQIIGIYQDYLNRYLGGGDAQQLICEFLDVQDIDEVVLNGGNQQNIILVAAKFRKEVTSTALWLLSHGVQIKCFKVTPYQLEELILLGVEQIIPTREAEEFMIGMSVKEADQKTAESTKKKRHIVRLKFWEIALKALRESSIQLFDNVNPSQDHWVNAGSGVRSVPYTIIFGQKEARVEISIVRSEKFENKFIFDFLHGQKIQIEEVFGDNLEWKRLDSIKASRIQYRMPFDGYNEDNWGEIIGWQVASMAKLERAFKGPLAAANDAVRTQEFPEEEC
ncbi:MAG: DUF4268 domain-containing protein [Alphaproteobacteria bacterium]|nr:DUF4268 domain-containing protein [Alphaproteobacteria bacterium]